MNTYDRFSKHSDKEAPRLTFYLVSLVPVVISSVLLRERLVRLKPSRLCHRDKKQEQRYKEDIVPFKLRLTFSL